jgi:hypothetical protein
VPKAEFDDLLDHRLAIRMAAVVPTGRKRKHGGETAEVLRKLTKPGPPGHPEKFVQDRGRPAARLVVMANVTKWWAVMCGGRHRLGISA